MRPIPLLLLLSALSLPAHVLANLTWKPRPGVTLKTVTVELRCYPSFFTSALARNTTH